MRQESQSAIANTESTAAVKTHVMYVLGISEVSLGSDKAPMIDRWYDRVINDRHFRIPVYPYRPAQFEMTRDEIQKLNALRYVIVDTTADKVDARIPFSARAHVEKLTSDPDGKKRMQLFNEPVPPYVAPVPVTDVSFERLMAELEAQTEPADTAPDKK